MTKYDFYLISESENLKRDHCGGMKLKNFELWLDESGSFAEDNLILKNDKMPSHVGGILYDSEVPLADILALCPGKGFHAAEDDKKTAYDLFCALEKKNIRFVLFQNKEKLLVVNDKLTYLSVISQGVMQLIAKLKGMYGEIHLTVFISERKDNPRTEMIAREKGGESQNYYIPIGQNEYVERLQERLILEGAGRFISEKDFTLRFGSARKDPRLILSDPVCNIFLIRKSEKLKNAAGREAGEFVSKVMENPEKTWMFSVLENSDLKYFRRFLLEGRLAEAVTTLCESADKKWIEEGMREIRGRISSFRDSEIDLQCRLLTSFMLHKLNVSRNFDELLSFFSHIENHFIPVIAEAGFPGAAKLADYLMFEAKFDQMTVYTHLGNVSAADTCVHVCKELLGGKTKDWDYLAYTMRLENRNIINLINGFRMEEALEACTKLCRQSSDIKDALMLTMDGDEFRFAEYGKALGTRAQISMLQIRKNPSCYEEAVRDSEAAVREFSDYQDQLRQFSYRIQIETEGNHEQEALLYLGKIIGIEYRSPDDIPKIAHEVCRSRSPFDKMAYIRLMGEGSLRNFTCSDQLYDSLLKERFFEAEEEGCHHPYEILYWKLGTCCAAKNNMKAAQRAYEKAIGICFANRSDVTMLCIGAAVELEEASFFIKNGIKANEILNSLKKHVRVLYETDLQTAMQCFGEEIRFPEKDEKEPVYLYYFKMSRKVTY